MKLSHTLVVLDIETTGLWIDKDRIIEIALIKCNVDGSRDFYDKRVNPGIPVPCFITELTSITNDDLKHAPYFRDIAKEVLEFIGDADLAGFNIEKFDLPVLEREFREVGCHFEWRNRKIYDVQKIYHLNEKRDLSAAYKFYCGKEMENAHKAMADTQATLEILSVQAERYGDSSLESLSRFNYKNNNHFYDKDKRFRWWNGKLYIMFGKYAKKYSLQELARKDPKYLEWIISADFSAEVKALAEDALMGRFPSYEEERNSEDVPNK